jgi:bifunctional enzyme CysN/CysC
MLNGLSVTRPAITSPSEQPAALRVLTAGSVDDGKSTLLGRLIVDSAQLFDDHLSALKRDSQRYGSAGKELDYSLVVDGLRAEREQGITIDVAYRYVSIAAKDGGARRLILADCPGHAQYTRNMATGASTAELALLLVDITHGITEQTRRHACVANLLGVPRVVVIANKLDLVDYAEAPYRELVEQLERLQRSLPIKVAHSHVDVVPVSALRGDNIVTRSQRMPWYDGQTVLELLQEASPAPPQGAGLRLPLQHVLRRDARYRGYAGRIASGELRPDDEVIVLPSGKRTRIGELTIGNLAVPKASAPLSVSVTLQQDLDVTRGDVLAGIDDVPELREELSADVVWMNEAPLQAGSRYRVKLACNTVGGEITALTSRHDLASFRPVEAQTLQLNDIGRIQLALDRELPVDPYERCRTLGSFILIDPITNATAGAGMVRESTG